MISDKINVLSRNPGAQVFYTSYIRNAGMLGRLDGIWSLGCCKNPDFYLEPVLVPHTT